MNMIDIFFSDLSNFLRAILIVLVVLLFVQRISQALSLIKEVRAKQEYIQDLKFGILSKKDLHNYTPREFEHWCSEFLQNQGFTNLQVSDSGPDGGKDIVCQKGTEKYYIECKRYSFSKNAEFKVDLEVARKLVGAMEVDGIKNGLIITTGYATEKAIEYINTLPKEYNLGIIDGDDLIAQYTAKRHLIYVPEKS